MGSNNTIRVKISRKPDPKTHPKTKPQTIKGSKSDDKESERKSEALDKWSQRIARIQLKMNLPAECGPKADDMLRKYLKNMKMTGRPIKAIAIACVYIAAKQVEMPHTLKEMAFINKVSVKQIGRYAQKVAEALRIDADPITPDQLISRFCYRLGLERAVERQAFHIANASYKLHVSSGPSVVAAAAIYMASQDSNDRSQWRSVEDVKGVACISTATIRNTCALFKNIRKSVLFILYSIHKPFVYIAAKQVEMPHTLKEMAFINKVSVKQIGRYAQKVAEALRIDADPITPDQLISRFCYRLGLERAVERQAFHIANASYKLHVSSGPSVVAAAAIYMASQDSNDRSQWRSVEDVKGVACISTATIRNTCALFKNIR
ncbi:unnamed protein product [Oppiella nova]|uniref:Cyclin-like domain-containing protein n=1 Tax=Oppiella nova TaxID=334625 RepID=A0A7R9LBI1_9ACAR|nr:unnamed protein product [Oppiella nova]CAG2161894.1 unnamed protein product [Oppiella nova]